MMSSFVFDTNVVVSAFLFANSIPRQALDYARSIGVLIISSTTSQELQTTLGRDKFDKYISKSTRLLLVKQYVDDAQIIEPTVTIAVCRDPEDNKYLELATTGKATYIVTGDDDLLTLNPYEDISIVTPREFLELTSK